jgi:eukaryotic-like serine/threonine-protein kinase
MAQPSWTPPGEFEEYKLLGRLGHGAMGQVWSAKDTLLNRTVALKFISALEGQPDVRERFLIEARAIAQLSHPNVVTIHRIGTLDGQPYTVTELVEGNSLDKVPKPLSRDAMLRIAVDLARGLAAAHRAGILHRDVKPANAMLGPHGAKLLDFGLAKFATQDSRHGSTAEPCVPEADDPGATLPSGSTAAAGEPKALDAQLTLEGTLLGTPLYLAPECWKREAASRRSDIYSLGALLYELAAGIPPVRFLPPGPLADVVARFDNRPLAEVAPHVDTRLAAIVDRCLRKDPLQRFGSGDELRETLERLAQVESGPVPAGNPYRGLGTYEAEHRAVFFGRDAEVRSVLERLRSGHVVVVVGESGAGKSSLCQAGILPALREGALGEGRAWKSSAVTPGRLPLRSLAAACAPVLGVDELELYEAVRAEPGHLARALLQALGPGQGVVLFVDQFEEWVTLADPLEAQLAATALAAVCSGFPALRVLATARSDLLPALTTLPGLGTELSGSLFLLGPVGREHLQAIITSPAAAHAVRFESSAMVEELVDFAAKGGALPLLQFALTRLWEERTGDVLSLTSLRRMGGVSGALARHADGVLARFGALQTSAAQRLLTSMVTASGTRRRRLQAELVRSDTDHAVLQTLSRERLVLARDSPEGTGWEIAHEALLREWPTLVRWLSEDSDARWVAERLGAATLEWERLGRPAEALWGAPRLADTTRVKLSPSPAEGAFLAASRRRVRRARWRVPSLMAAVALAGASSFALARWNERRALVQKVASSLERARGHLQLAVNERPQWEMSRGIALAAYDSGDYPRGEAEWTVAGRHLEQWTRGATLAAVEVDHALALNPTEPSARAVGIQVALERVSLARAHRNSIQEEAAIAQLQTFGVAVDARGTAEVVVSVTPPNAVLTLFQDQPGVALRHVPLLDGHASLPPGSWRLHAEADGYAKAWLPFVTERATDVRLTLELLPLEQVPVGFVHVPAGSSEFGATGDDSVRRDFYEAPPLHRIEVPGFLMARHEITFGEWLEWLDTLDEPERRRRTPRVQGNTGVASGASLRLDHGPAGWTLTLTPIRQPYVGLPHQPLRYADRTVNVEHDWYKMPVVGVTPVDLEAYAQWLDRTGRVPGARLCLEQEWERAARGADARTLPHGDVAEPMDGNVDVTYGRKDKAFGPDQVGLHPRSRSPFGIDDLLGNVWEVVRPASSLKPFASKGGAWNVNLLAARIPNDWVLNEEFRQVETGGRICASLPKRRIER